MSRKRNPRRRPVNSVTATCEMFEVRCLLTQLVPTADLAGRYPQMITETPHAAILSSYTGQANGIAVAVFDKESGSLGEWQQLRGGSSILASLDGSTLLSSLSLYEPDTGVYSGTEYLFYHRSSSTGLFEETARYEFSYVDYGYVQSASAIESDGAYVNSYRPASPATLLFMPSNQAPEPYLIFGSQSGPVYLTGAGRNVFAYGYTIGLQLLQPDGLNPKRIGGSNDSPVAVAGGNVLISRDAGTLHRLVSTDLATGAEETLLVYPGDSSFQLYSEDGGPDGKTILGLSGPRNFNMITTDGTAAGTSVFPATQEVAGEFYNTTAVPIQGTTRVLVSRAGVELLVWDLSDGSNHRLVDTNPYGADRISGLSGSGADAWFVAQTDNSQFGVFRTNGLLTTLEFQLPGDSGAQVIAAADTAYLLDRSPVTGAVAGYRAAIYRIDQQAPDLISGPANLRTAVVAAADSLTLNLHWDSVIGESFYEVLVEPWQESGQYVFDPYYLNVSATSYGTDYSIDISGKGYYGWQTVLVRGITNTGVATKWSALTFSFTEAPVLPANGQFFLDHNALRFGYRNYNGQNYRLQIRRSNDPTSEYIFDSPVGLSVEQQTQNSPFPDSNYYFYLGIPNLEDGDYTVEFVHQYVDPMPDIQDLSLPRISTKLVLSIRSRMVVRNPEALNVAVQQNGVQLSWNGSLQQGDEGFEVWVNDIGRSIPKVIHQTVIGHSLLHDLPNGRYRGWVGLKNPVTGITHWSPAEEFALASKAPRVLSPGAVSATERPVFQWTGSKSSSYEIWLSDLETGKRVVLANVNGATQWTPQSKLPAGRYAFWVRERVTSTAASPWSARLLLTQQDPAIQVTSGLSPGLDQTPVLGWQGRTGAISYELWIGRVGVPGPAYRQTGITGTTHRVMMPLGNGDFKVWVRADLGGGRTTGWGEGYSISIGATVALNVTGTTVSWNAIPTATHYELWINYEGGERSKQARIVYQAIYIPTAYTLSVPLPKGRYTAWIRAVRAEAGSLYQGSWSRAVELQLSQAAEPGFPDANLLTELFTVIAHEGLAEVTRSTGADDLPSVDVTQDSVASPPAEMESTESGQIVVPRADETQTVAQMEDSVSAGRLSPAILPTPPDLRAAAGAPLTPSKVVPQL